MALKGHFRNRGDQTNSMDLVPAISAAACTTASYVWKVNSTTTRAMIAQKVMGVAMSPVLRAASLVQPRRNSRTRAAVTSPWLSSCANRPKSQHESQGGCFQSLPIVWIPRRPDSWLHRIICRTIHLFGRNTNGI
ncbi:uncharacterized protein LOC117645019 [Thrips palmi]|uniref:Uncharacterized protein LOC117645019 n=1 Tax=Thrips palmi TaxID=161013 RepID=A0A6P8Z2H1_THRPL|nr:uncharacterized protein LOC117645019 [Thrips palmi]